MMTKKFICLTRSLFDSKILISINDIAGIDEDMSGRSCRIVYMAIPPHSDGWLTFDVKETIEEIQKMIKESDNFWLGTT